MILALDLGTTTGWAVGGGGARAIYGSQTFKTDRYSGGGMRFLRFRSWLAQTYSMVLFDRLYFEEVRSHKGVDAAHVYGGFLATLTAWCEEHSVPYEGVPVGVIKKSATGKGNAGKAEVIEAMRSAGYAPCDDNEADALALLRYVLTLA